jgi:hypothetical protein
MTGESRQRENRNVTVPVGNSDIAPSAIAEHDRTPAALTTFSLKRRSSLPRAFAEPG